MTRIATAENPADLPTLPLKSPTDLKTDLQGRLLVNIEGGSIQTPTDFVLGLDNKVLVKASPGAFLSAQFRPVQVFDGQRYFQVYNADDIADVVLGFFATWSVPFTPNNIPVIIERDLALTTGICIGVSMHPAVFQPDDEILPAGIAGVMFQ